MRTYSINLVIWDNYPDTTTRRIDCVLSGVNEDELRGVITSVVHTLTSVGYRSISSSPHRIMMFGDRTGAKRVIVKHEIETRDEN